MVEAQGLALSQAARPGPLACEAAQQGQRAAGRVGTRAAGSRMGKGGMAGAARLHGRLAGGEG